MHLFTDYIQPLTDWLQANPHWAIAITFLFSFAESLAIVGSIIPGSVTMTAIGILAGSGIMRIDLTFAAAILGAMAGDSASYALGYWFHDRLSQIWPFKRYPKWLIFGKEYFAHHGGKSVLIGRFFGPLRSVIPVIAGMMHMSQWRFFIANFISAIGWSVLYVMPGVLIGAASHELSAENATRLFALILGFLILLWLVSFAIKWLFVRLNRILKTNLHLFWSWSKRHPHLAKLFNRMTPKDEENHFPTAALVFSTLLLVLCLLSLLLLELQQSWVAAINTPLNLLFQSLRTNGLDAFFILCNQISSLLTLSLITLGSLALLIYARAYRALIYLCALLLTTSVANQLATLLITSPRPGGLMASVSPGSFPDSNLSLTVALFGYLLLLIYKNKQLSWQYLKKPPVTSLSFKLMSSLIISLLFLNALSLVFLGDYWLSTTLCALSLGATLCLVFWVFYRIKAAYIKLPFRPSLVLLISTLLLMLVSFSFNFYTARENHLPYQKQYILTEHDWWLQRQVKLPSYRLNRIGKPTSLFNLQYVGNLKHLETALKHSGWVTYNDSLFNRLLQRMTAPANFKASPIFTQLYGTSKPALVMILNHKTTQEKLILRIWRSNYHLESMRTLIWLGSVHRQWQSKTIKSNGHRQPILYNPILTLYPSLKDFKLKVISLKHPLKDIPYKVVPKILLIKERETNELFDSSQNPPRPGP